MMQDQALLLVQIGYFFLPRWNFFFFRWLQGQSVTLILLLVPSQFHGINDPISAYGYSRWQMKFTLSKRIISIRFFYGELWLMKTSPSGREKSNKLQKYEYADNKNVTHSGLEFTVQQWDVKCAIQNIYPIFQTAQNMDSGCCAYAPSLSYLEWPMSSTRTAFCKGTPRLAVGSARTEWFGPDQLNRYASRCYQLTSLFISFSFTKLHSKKIVVTQFVLLHIFYGFLDHLLSLFMHIHWLDWMQTCSRLGIFFATVDWSIVRSIDWLIDWRNVCQIWIRQIRCSRAEAERNPEPALPHQTEAVCYAPRSLRAVQYSAAHWITARTRKRARQGTVPYCFLIDARRYFLVPLFTSVFIRPFQSTLFM